MLHCRKRRALVTGLLGCCLALAMQHGGLLDAWEARTWDWRVRVMAQPGEATDRIRLVFLDQASLDWAKEVNGLAWPWPREVHALLIDHLAALGARAVVFDVLFTEPSAYGEADDQRLAQAMADSRRFVSALFLTRAEQGEPRWPDGVKRPQLAISGQEAMPEAMRRRLEHPKATFPLPDFSNAAQLPGTVQMIPDEDGVYRRVPLFSLFDGHVIPSLGLAPLLLEAPAGWMRLDFASNAVHVADRPIDIDASGLALLRFRGPSGTHRNYSAAAVLQDALALAAGQPPVIQDRDAFRDRIVFFGFSAPGLFDLRTSPVSAVYPGVEIWATLADNLLSGDAARRAGVWTSTLAVVILAMLTAALVNCLERASVQSLAVACLLPMPVALGMLAYARGVWLPVLPPMLGVLVSFTTAVLINYAMEGKQKRFIKSAFKQYLHPDYIELLIKHPERLKLGGERRVLSIFFSDLEGFTTLSESLSPEGVTQFLNNYLTAMTDIILEEGGTVDKYEGDAIIAFWNAPADQPDHAARAVRAALRCQARLAALRPAYRKQLGVDVRMRIGLNTGVAIVGNLGSNTRFDYTMISDAVNLAARLESLNKQFGTYTMCTDATREACLATPPAGGEHGNVVFRELGRVRVKGKTQPVVVHEPALSPLSEAAQAHRAAFAEALEAYYAGRLEEASSLFTRLASADPAAAAYAERCREAVAAGEAGMAEAWSGVWVMTTK